MNKSTLFCGFDLNYWRNHFWTVSIFLQEYRNITQKDLKLFNVHERWRKSFFFVYYERKFLSIARKDIPLLVNHSRFSVFIIFFNWPNTRIHLTCHWGSFCNFTMPLVCFLTLLKLIFPNFESIKMRKVADTNEICFMIF